MDQSLLATRWAVHHFTPGGFLRDSRRPWSRPKGHLLAAAAPWWWYLEKQLQVESGRRAKGRILWAWDPMGAPRPEWRDWRGGGGGQGEMKENREGRRVRGRTFSSGKDLVAFRRPFPSPPAWDLSPRGESACSPGCSLDSSAWPQFQGPLPSSSWVRLPSCRCPADRVLANRGRGGWAVPSCTCPAVGCRMRSGEEAGPQLQLILGFPNNFSKRASPGHRLGLGESELLIQPTKQGAYGAGE